MRGPLVENLYPRTRPVNGRPQVQTAANQTLPLTLGRGTMSNAQAADGSGVGQGGDSTTGKDLVGDKSTSKPEAQSSGAASAKEATTQESWTADRSLGEAQRAEDRRAGLLGPTFFIGNETNLDPNADGTFITRDANDTEFKTDSERTSYRGFRCSNAASGTRTGALLMHSLEDPGMTGLSEPIQACDWDRLISPKGLPSPDFSYSREFICQSVNVECAMVPVAEKSNPTAILNKANKSEFKARIRFNRMPGTRTGGFSDGHYIGGGAGRALNSK